MKGYFRNIVGYEISNKKPNFPQNSFGDLNFFFFEISVFIKIKKEKNFDSFTIGKIYLNYWEIPLIDHFCLFF